MTIALLTDGIPPFIHGGMQKHSKLITEYLAREGVDVLLYHYVSQSHLVDEMEVKEQFSFAVQERIHVRTFLYEDNGRLPGHYLRAQRRLSNEYVDRLKEESKRVDFIYAKGFMGWELVNHKHDFEPIKIGVNFHGMNMFQKQPDIKSELIKYMLRPTVRKIMNGADFVFSYGGRITHIIEEQIDRKDKVITFPTGIEESWVAEEVVETSEKLVFLFIGRYDRLKGLPELYAALTGLTEGNRPFTVTFVGPIPEKDRLLDDRCVYTGPIYEQAELMNEMDRSDIIICPSISEGMPNVILEGMARGLAIFATDVGANSVMVDQNNGILVSPGSVNAIIEGFRFFLKQDIDQLNQMKINSLSKLKTQFLWADLAKRFKEVLIKKASS